MPQEIARLVQHLTERQRDKLQVRVDALPLRGWQRSEQPILLRIEDRGLECHCDGSRRLTDAKYTLAAGSMRASVQRLAGLVLRLLPHGAGRPPRRKIPAGELRS